MKKFILVLFLLPLISLAQTTALNFIHKNGETVGRSVVMDLPVSLFNYWEPQGQLLIFYPPAYKTKLCALDVFNAGDGEQQKLDVTLVNKNSLPRMIAAGLTPYSILPNKDTLWHVVVSIHNNAGSAYRSQLTRILPWIFDKSGIKFDPHHVWIMGLSGGGSATWAAVMSDTSLSRRITGIMPMANGGYDSNLDSLRNNLITACKQGVYFFPYIGTQDPGDNPSSFGRYDSLLKKNALPDHYHPHIIVGGTHDASTWDVPFNSRVIWDSLGTIGYVPPAPVIPNVVARLIVDSLVIHYPTTWINVWDSSRNSQGGSWDILSGPNRPIVTGLNPTHAQYSGLIPGAYTVGIHVYGTNGSEDSAKATILVYGPPACPPPVICPICPIPRSVKTVNMVLIGGIWQLQFIYTDGSSQ